MIKEGRFRFGLRPAWTGIYACGLLGADTRNRIVDDGFIVAEGFMARGANRKVFLQPVLFFLAELAGG